MLQNTLILGFFSISAFQDYRNRKINIYFLLTGGIIGLLFHLYSMEFHRDFTRNGDWNDDLVFWVMVRWKCRACRWNDSGGQRDIFGI